MDNILKDTTIYFQIWKSKGRFYTEFTSRKNGVKEKAIITKSTFDQLKIDGVKIRK